MWPFALLSEYVGVAAGLAVLAGMANGVPTYVIQEARGPARYRRQALIAAAGGFVGCLAMSGLIALVGQAALLVVLLLTVVSPPAVGRCVVLARRTGTLGQPSTDHYPTTVNQYRPG